MKSDTTPYPLTVKPAEAVARSNFLWASKATPGRPDACTLGH